MHQRYWMMLALLTSACAADFGAANQFAACDAEDRCANGFTCVTHPTLGRVCLDDEQRQQLCAPEACNGRDDDCDGEIDEEFADLDLPCTVGVGACAVDGITVCIDDGSGTTCDAVARSPLPESCNGLDDDCDGQTDNGVADAIAGTDEGECAVRVERCMGGLPIAISEGIFPTDEECNDLDDDCDGDTDEGVGPIVSGSAIGECRNAVAVCDGGASVVIQPGTDPALEACNNRDDDCDGETDEGFLGLGQLCIVGFGACMTSGTTTCTDDQAGTTCNASEGTPGTELCDGVDNDCDGETDEDFVELGLPCSAGTGQCRAEGVFVCASDRFGTTCDATPTAPTDEVCNGLDDDCDGRIDWVGDDCCVPDTRRPCGIALGQCTVGEQFCRPNRQWGSCSGQGPVPEACNGRDDDCDGIADDGAGCTCAPGATQPCSVDRGACRAGQQFCTVDHEWSACSGVLPAAVDSCNGLDDDCDGRTDEDFPELWQACTVGRGACAASGAFTCAGDGGSAGCSASAGDPTAEVCNGLDDDCDGATDEDIVIRRGTDTGECQEGIQRCLDGELVDVQSYVPPADESCNGLDDDCDGATDDEAPECCTPGEVRTCGFRRGVCTVGSQRCGDDRAWGECTGALPSDESCNGLDDDCDGLTDEQWVRLVGSECTVGRGICVRTGTWVCNPNFSPSDDGEREGVACDAVPGDPGTESCNGQDDDCDGLADEIEDLPPVFTGSDVGECQPSISMCRGGQTVEVRAARASSPEVCDGRDNNCSGLPDDGIPSVACYEGPIGSNGVGVCREGVTSCMGGNVRCVTQVLPSPETCDNVDNDCNDVTDGSLDADGNQVPLQDSCYTGPDGTLGIGECRAGTTTCTGGTWGSCADEVLPSRESCDELDNDCDGEIDNSLTAWRDGFESDDFNAWTVSGRGTPRIDHGIVWSGSSTGRFTADYSSLYMEEDRQYITRAFNACIGDARLTAKVLVIGWTDGPCVGIDLGFLWSGDDGGHLRIRGQSQGAYINRSGGATPIDFTLAPDLSIYRWYDVGLDRRGATVEVLVNGVSYAVVEDESREAIGIWVGVAAGCVDGASLDVVFDDVMIEPL